MLADRLLPTGHGAADLRERLERRVAIAVEPGRTVQRTYYDTFDGRVRAAGAVLVHERGRLVLTGADGREAAAAAVARRPVAVRAGDLPGAAPVLDVRTALPLGRARIRCQRWRVLDEERKTVLRLVLEEPAGLAARVRLQPVRGYDKARARVERLLEGEGVVPAPEPLADAVVRAAGGVPGGVSSKLDVAVAPGDRADDAAAAIARRLLDTVRTTLPGTLQDVDPEFLHDVRVAVRRTRALQRELRTVFPPAELARFRDGFRRLQQVTGPTRDLDVQLLEFDEVAGEEREVLEPLRALLESKRRTERRRMARQLQADGTRVLLDAWGAHLDALRDAPEEDRPDAGRPIAGVAGDRITRVYRHMVRMGRAIDDATPPEALHDLRKKGKELRYLLEFFGPLFPAEEVRPMVRTLKALQDTLGRYQDREVQAGVLRGLGDELAVKPRADASALMAMGVLAARLEEQQAQARAEFAERFAPFAAKERRRAVVAAFA